MPPTAHKKTVSENLRSLNQQKLRKLDLAVTGVSNNRSPMTSPKTVEDKLAVPRKQIRSDGATDCDSVEEDIVAMLNKGSAQLTAVSCISSRSRHRDI